MFQQTLHVHLNDMLSGCCGNDVAADGLAVDSDALNAFLCTVGIVDGDDVFAIAELPSHGELTGGGGHARVDKQSVVGGFDAEDELCDGVLPYP